jgi:protein ImuB
MEERLDFDTPETNVERVLFVFKRLLDGLLARLAQQSCAVVQLALDLTLDDRTRRAELVRPAAPTIDVVSLLALVRLRLGALRLSAGIVSLRVGADTCRADPQQLRLLQQAKRDPDAADQACARLRAELGERAVVRARLCDAHLPGSRFAWEPLDHVPVLTHARVVAARPLVRRIYTKESADGLPPADRLRSVSGPYVLAGGWWSGSGGVARDYYFACGEEGDLRWMYFDHRKKRLFLQGEVE